MQATTIAALAAFSGALLVLLTYHLSLVGPRLARLRLSAEAHDAVLGDGRLGGRDRLAALESAAQAQRTAADRLAERVQLLEHASRTDLSRCGFVRYNAFSDTGSELSYALALLNREGDGVLLSSIFSREDTRTFGKAVAKFRPAQDSSPEELRAIGLAKESA